MGELCSRTSKSTSAKSLFSLCAPHCLNEFAHQAPIFLAGTRFDAARDVNPVGAHDANRRRHVLDLQPTRQNDTEEHTSELQSLAYLVCRLLLEKKTFETTLH